MAHGDLPAPRRKPAAAGTGASGTASTHTKAGGDAPRTQDYAMLEQRLRDLEERLRVVQEQRDREREERAVDSLLAGLQKLQHLVTPEVRMHLKAGWREQLLALQAFLEAAVTLTEENAAPKKPPRAESVRID